MAFSEEDIEKAFFSTCSYWKKNVWVALNVSIMSWNQVVVKADPLLHSNCTKNLHMSIKSEL